MSSDNKTLKHYRTIGHQLSPIVIIANGITENIHAELIRALKDHELIKIKLHANNRDEKKSLIEEVCKTVDATLIQLTGNIALIFKAAKKPNPKLSNLLRHSK